MDSTTIWFCVFMVSFVTMGALQMVMVIIAVPKGYEVRTVKSIGFFRDLIKDETDPVKRAKYKRLLFWFGFVQVVMMVSFLMMFISWMV